MKITEEQLDDLIEFFNTIGTGYIDDEWVIRHTDIKFDDTTKSVTITIDNMNEQEYGWVKGDSNETG